MVVVETARYELQASNYGGDDDLHSYLIADWRRVAVSLKPRGNK